MAQPPKAHPHGADDAAAPLPNRRERRGGKSATSAAHRGRSSTGSRYTPVVPPRQYSTRRRSG
jgi:hypothetical protein